MHGSMVASLSIVRVSWQTAQSSSGKSEGKCVTRHTRKKGSMSLRLQAFLPWTTRAENSHTLAKYMHEHVYVIHTYIDL